MTPATLLFLTTLAVAIANQAAVWAQLALCACVAISAWLPAVAAEPEED